MITKKTVIGIILACLCLIGAYFIHPLTEQYQGMTGYIYENGMYYHLLFFIFLVSSVLLFAYSLIEMREIES